MINRIPNKVTSCYLDSRQRLLGSNQGQVRPADNAGGRVPREGGSPTTVPHPCEMTKAERFRCKWEQLARFFPRIPITRPSWCLLRADPSWASLLRGAPATPPQCLPRGGVGASILALEAALNTTKTHTSWEGRGAKGAPSVSAPHAQSRSQRKLPHTLPGSSPTSPPLGGLRDHP